MLLACQKGTSAGEFIQTPCGMQCGLDLLLLDYTKERNNREQTIVLGFSPKVQQKENDVRVHSGGFQQTPMHIIIVIP